MLKSYGPEGLQAPALGEALARALPGLEAPYNLKFPPDKAGGTVSNRARRVPEGLRGVPNVKTGVSKRDPDLDNLRLKVSEPGRTSLKLPRNADN